MPKIAKAAAKTVPQNPPKDLFSDLSEAPARRLPGKGTRAGKFAGGGS